MSRVKGFEVPHGATAARERCTVHINDAHDAEVPVNGKELEVACMHVSPRAQVQPVNSATARTSWQSRLGPVKFTGVRMPE